MGEVYRARDTRLDREVALKRLVDRALDDEVAHRRILREARAAGALSHPGIATIFDVLDTTEGLFIVMEYVPGETLGTRVGEQGLSVNAALDVGLQIARALEHAHEKGIVHRDLKPANVHVTPTGQAKILDFGIAKSILEARDPPGVPAKKDDLATAAGLIVGSPGYMAPEQIMGLATDARTDIYALGVVLFELIAGRRPFAGTDLLTTAMATLNEATPRLVDVAPRVPRNVSELVERAMARTPENRFQSAAALASALEQARQTLVNAETHLVEAAALQVRPAIRKRTIATTTLLFIAVAALVIWAGLKSGPAEAKLPVVGVTPFHNATGDKNNDPIVAGLTDAVMKQLGSVRSLRVLPLDEVREAVKVSQGRKSVARTLGASFVVEGSLRGTGHAIEVDVFLSGEDGQRKPVGRFPADAARPFELHKVVTEAVAQALRRQGVMATDTALAATPPTSNPEAFADYAQARVFLERPDVTGSLDTGIRLLERAIEKDGNFALAYAALGEAFWIKWRETNNAEWTARAQTANLEALRIDSAQPEVRMALAVMYEGRGQWEKAVTELQQVLAMQPRNDEAHRVLSRIARAQGRSADAISEARTAVDLRPSYWRNHLQLGDALNQAGEFEAAVSTFKRLLELQPDSARGFQRLGNSLQALGRNDEALEAYESASRISPTPATYSNMATIYYWRGDYERARDVYERAIALSPNRPDLYGNLGDVLMKLGRRQRAQENYRRAVDETSKSLTVNGNDAPRVASLALYRAKLGDRAGAAEAIARALRLSPEDGDVLYHAAIVHALAGDTSAGCERIAQAIKHGKNTEEIRQSDELKSLKGCASYDAVSASAR